MEEKTAEDGIRAAANLLLVVAVVNNTAQNCKIYLELTQNQKRKRSLILPLVSDHNNTGCTR